MTSDVSSSSTKTNRDAVSVAVTEQGGKSIFKLTFQGEVLPLVDSGTLNRWASIGIVDRHKITVSQDGVTVDGRHIGYGDPNAAGELERILNRSQAPSPSPAARPAESAHPQTAVRADVTSSLDSASDLRDSVRVTREGFES
jgi:hypothetical protein